METINEGIDAQRLSKELLLAENHDLREEIRNSNVHVVDRRELDKLDENLKRNVDVYTAAKQELAPIEESIAELKKTEEELTRVSQSLRDEDQLQETSAKTASVNEIKSKTLDEISAMVQAISQKLNEKKQDLEPKVCTCVHECGHRAFFDSSLIFDAYDICYRLRSSRKRGRNFKISKKSTRRKKESTRHPMPNRQQTMRK